ncbi:MAG: hypothetical protein GX241_04300 [Ruminococcaceae bacterium]|nr:hypothetical protein [Oscillospiraceae bacterium]
MSTPEKKWVKPLGIIVIIFAIIGLVFAIVAAVSAIKDTVFDKTSEKLEYQKMLVPVVMNDIDEFDDVTKAKMTQLIEVSVWAIIKSDIGTDEYTTEEGYIIIPENDVKDNFIKLFGTDVEIEHQSVYSNAFEIEYDAEKQGYKIPITGVEATYVPKVLEITKKSDTIILTVAYLSGSDWVQDEHGNIVEPDASKYVKITLREKNKSYYIGAIQPTNAPETLEEKQKK